MPAPSNVAPGSQGTGLQTTTYKGEDMGFQTPAEKAELEAKLGIATPPAVITPAKAVSRGEDMGFQTPAEKAALEIKLGIAKPPMVTSTFISKGEDMGFMTPAEITAMETKLSAPHAPIPTTTTPTEKPPPYDPKMAGVQQEALRQSLDILRDKGLLDSENRFNVEDALKAGVSVGDLIPLGITPTQIAVAKRGIEKEGQREAISIADKIAWDNKLTSLGNFYNKTTNQIEVYGAIKGGKAQVLRDLGVDTNLIKRIETDVAQEKQYGDWTADELLHGRLDSFGKYTSSPYGTKDGVSYGYPIWAQVKIVESQLDAIKNLAPYKVVQETGRIIATGEGQVKETVTFYDIPTAIQNLTPISTIKQAGFADKDIDAAKTYLADKAKYDAQVAELQGIINKLAPYKETKIDPMSTTESISAGMRVNYDIGKAANDKAITIGELEKLGYKAEDIHKAQVYSDVGWKAYIPVYGTVALFGVSSTPEKVISIGSDVLFVVGVASAVAKMGSTGLKLLTTATKAGITPELGFWGGRMGTALKSAGYLTEQTVTGTVKFPFQLIKEPGQTLKGLWEVTTMLPAHPIESAKGIWAVGTGKVYTGTPSIVKTIEGLVSSKLIPEAAIAIPTKGTGVQRLFISGGLTPEEAVDATQRMELYAYNLANSGRPIPETISIPVNRGGKLFRTIEFPMASAMRELGIAVHATPFGGRVFAGAAEPIGGKTPLYFSPAMSDEWATATARGQFTREVITAGRGGAIAVQPVINQTLDPVSKVYRSSVELEATTPKSGALLVTDAENFLATYTKFGKAYIYPARLMEQIPNERIMDAVRATGERTYTFKPINFNEIESLPKSSAGRVEAYIRENDIMVGGSASENTWTKSIHRAEDLDLISLRDTAKVDAQKIADIIHEMSGVETRVVQPPGRDVYRIQRKVGEEWQQVSDVLDYSVQKTYNPEVRNYEPVEVNGIKIENPREQAERIVQKYKEYQEGKISLETHRGHSKRLAWITQAMLDAQGGKPLSAANQEILNTISTRIDFSSIQPDMRQLVKIKLEGIRDTIRDTISERRIKILTPDGKEVEVPESISDSYDQWVKSNPSATPAQEQEVRTQLLIDAEDTYIDRLLRSPEYLGSMLLITRANTEVLYDKLRQLPLAEQEAIGIEDMSYSEFTERINDIINLRLSESARDYSERVTPPEIPETRTSRINEDLGRIVRAGRESPRGEITTREDITREETTVERVPSREDIPREPIVRIGREPFDREIGYTFAERDTKPPIPTPHVPPYEPYKPPDYRYDYKPPKPPPPILTPRQQEQYKKQVDKIKPGTLVWVQGRPQGGGMYKVLPPPYLQDDMFTMRRPPPGYLDEGFTGEGSAFKSLQIIGGNPPESVENIDLGFVKINVKLEAGKPVISYAQDEDANVGKREFTIGMGEGQIPVEVAQSAKEAGVSGSELIQKVKAGEDISQFEVAETAENLPEEKVTNWRTIKAEAPRGLGKTELVQYRTGKVKVYLVDGEYVRNNIYIDFSVSGNECVFVKIDGLVSSVSLKELYEKVEYTPSIKESISVLSLDTTNYHYNWAKLGNVIKHKTVEPLLRITTRCGRQAVVTQSHSCLTVGNDGEIVEIKPINMKVGGTPLPIIGKLDGNTNAEWDISCHESGKYKGEVREKVSFGRVPLSKELGFILGIYLAEGYIGRREVAVYISACEDNIRAKAKSCIEYLGMHCNDKRKDTITACNTQLSRAIKMEFGSGSLNKKIPAWVLDSPKEFREALIDGYWSGDGSVREFKEWGIIACASSDSRDLSYGIQLILASLGIQCSVNKYDYIPKGFKNPHTIHYRLKVGASCVGGMPMLTHQEKERCRKLYKMPKQDNIAVAPVPANLTKGSLRQRGKKGYCGLSRVKRQCQNEIVSKLTNGNIIWDIVTKLEECPFEEYTYDLEIDDNRTFVLASGITVHNTQGGHDKVYPKFIPPNEIWLDRNLNIIDRKATLLHELVEREKMSNKMSYEKAHSEYANIAEVEARKNIKMLDDRLEEELDKHPNGVEPYKQREVVPALSRSRVEDEEVSESVRRPVKKSSGIAERYYLGRKISSANLGTTSL